MSHSHKDELFPDDLQRVADLLGDGRPTLEQLALDRVKPPAMSEALEPPSTPEKGSFTRSRIATLFTVGFLMLGTGGTLALAGADGMGNSAASASFNQYRPPCVQGKGLGVPNECPGEKVKKGGQGGKHGGHKGHKGGHKGKHKSAHKGGHKRRHKRTRKGIHKSGHGHH